MFHNDYVMFWQSVIVCRWIVLDVYEKIQTMSGTPGSAQRGRNIVTAGKKICGVVVQLPVRIQNHLQSMNVGHHLARVCVSILILRNAHLKVMSWVIVVARN